MQTNAPLDETRKNIWLVDSKVVDHPDLTLLSLVGSFYLIKLLSKLLSSLLYFPQGLIVSSRKESLQHFKKPWAHEHKPIRDLVDAVNVCLSHILPHLFLSTSVLNLVVCC